MPTMQQISRALLVVTSLALMPPALSQAQADRDTQEINSYVLTDAGLACDTKATQTLGPLAKKACSDCGDDNPQTLDQMVATFNSMPGAKAAIQSAGMTTREYVVFSWSILQTGIAAWGLSKPGGKLPPGVSMANVNFYRRNEAALQELGELIKLTDCEENEAEESAAE